MRGFVVSLYVAHSIVCNLFAGLYQILIRIVLDLLNIMAAATTPRIGACRCTDLPLRLSLLGAGPAFMEPTDLESDTKTSIHLHLHTIVFLRLCPNKVLLSDKTLIPNNYINLLWLHYCSSNEAAIIDGLGCCMSTRERTIIFPDSIRKSG